MTLILQHELQLNQWAPPPRKSKNINEHQKGANLVIQISNNIPYSLALLLSSEERNKQKKEGEMGRGLNLCFICFSLSRRRNSQIQFPFLIYFPTLSQEPKRNLLNI